MEDESSVVKHLRAMLQDAADTINTQRCRIAELEYDRHQHDLLYQHPWQYFFWRIFVWPFHPENRGAK